MIRLLEVPPRGPDSQDDDYVCLCDPNGSYLRREVTDGCRQIVVKGPMQGTPKEYTEALSRSLGQQMVVREFSELKRAMPHDVRCYSIIARPS